MTNAPEVLQIRPIPLSGCFMVVTGVLTLGVAPLAIWWTQRRWPKLMNADGFVTSAGKRYRWSDIRALRRVITIVNNVRTERFDLETERGAVAHIVVHRLHQGDQVLAYAREAVRAAGGAV